MLGFLFLFISFKKTRLFFSSPPCTHTPHNPHVVSSLFIMYAMQDHLFFFPHWMHARPLMSWGRDLPTKSPMGHRRSSRCCFMAAFVPHAACLALRVGNGAIMHFMHACTCSPARARAELTWEKFHACLLGLGACWARALLVGLGCPSCKKDRNHEQR